MPFDSTSGTADYSSSYRVEEEFSKRREYDQLKKEVVTTIEYRCVRMEIRCGLELSEQQKTALRKLEI